MSRIENDKWVKRWVVESSSGGGEYVIGMDAEGNYGCSCPAWTRNVVHRCTVCGERFGRLDKRANDMWWCIRCRDTRAAVVERRGCKHIDLVKSGRARTLAETAMDKMLGRVR